MPFSAYVGTRHPVGVQKSPGRATAPSGACAQLGVWKGKQFVESLNLLLIWELVVQVGQGLRVDLTKRF